MNLTVKEKTAFDKLPVGLQEFAKNRMEKTVVQLNEVELKTACLDIISVAYAEQNQYQIEAKILAHQRDLLILELKDKRFKTLTISEVRKAFKSGIRGESGPFFGLCSKTYYQFLKCEFDKPERVEAMKKFMELTEAENFKRVEKPLEVKFQETKESVLKSFEIYKEAKELPFAAFAYYDFLWKELKIINLTKEEKNKIRNEAGNEYTSELKLAKVRGHIKSADYEYIIANLNEENKTFLSKVKKFALKYFFDQLINSNKELKDIVK